jgi:hypothetical protein
MENENTAIIFRFDMKKIVDNIPTTIDVDLEDEFVKIFPEFKGYKPLIINLLNNLGDHLKVVFEKNINISNTTKFLSRWKESMAKSSDNEIVDFFVNYYLSKDNANNFKDITYDSFMRTILYDEIEKNGMKLFTRVMLKSMIISAIHSEDYKNTIKEICKDIKYHANN